MSRMIAVVVAVAMTSQPFVAAQEQATTGAVSGVATSTEGEKLVNATVRVRDLDSGEVVATGTTSATGEFIVTGLRPGNYTVEIMDAAGVVVGVSASLSVTAGAVVSGVAVTASTTAAAAAAAGGAVAGGAAAAGGAAGGAAAGGAVAAAGAAAGGAAAVSTAAIVTAVAAGVGVTGAVVAQNQDEASPSR